MQPTTVEKSIVKFMKKLPEQTMWHTLTCDGMYYLVLSIESMSRAVLVRFHKVKK